MIVLKYRLGLGVVLLSLLSAGVAGVSPPTGFSRAFKCLVGISLSTQTQTLPES